MTARTRLVGTERDAELTGLVAARPELGAPLAGAAGHREAEVVYAVTHEGAMEVDDVLARRTAIATTTTDHGAAAAPRVAELIEQTLAASGA